MVAAELLAVFFLAYLALGIAFSVPFVAFGLQRVDADAKGGTFGFRLIIIPGVVALWPLLLQRWVRGEGSAPAERNAHRVAAGPE